MVVGRRGEAKPHNGSNCSFPYFRIHLPTFILRNTPSDSTSPAVSTKKRWIAKAQSMSTSMQRLACVDARRQPLPARVKVLLSIRTCTSTEAEHRPGAQLSSPVGMASRHESYLGAIRISRRGRIWVRKAVGSVLM